MSFQVQKWQDISNGWSDIRVPSKKEARKKKKEGGKGRKKMKGKKKGE